MSFGRPWWLLGLALLVPLVLAHLRRRASRSVEVPAVARWQALATEAAPASRRLRPPPAPWLLLLEAAILSLAVLALAAPHRAGHGARSTSVVVLDESLWMRPAGRLAAAARLARAFAAAAPSGGRLALVLAGPEPAVAYTGGAGGLAAALARVRPVAEPADLHAAILTGASLLAGPGARLVLVRAPEDAAPPVAGAVTEDVVGGPLDDRGLFDPVARCGIGATAACEILVRLRNDAARAATVAINASVARGATTRFHVRVAARSEAPVVLSATARARVTLRIATPDAIAADDVVHAAVPGPGDTPAATVVTLVGTPAGSTALARAFASVPGVTLRLREPGQASAADVAASDLLVLDGAVPTPPGAAPAMLLVHPATVPGGRAAGADRGATTATSSRSDPLLEGVDLTSLTIRAGAVRRYTTPPWLQPLVVAGSTPLLAAGGDSRGRLALLAFEPSSSDLPQLEALPILARNLVRWAAAWAPATVAAGVPFTLPRLGSGTGVAAVAGLAPGDVALVDGAHRARTVSASVEPRQPPVEVGAARGVSSQPAALAPWLLLAALAGIAVELATARRARRSR